MSPNNSLIDHKPIGLLKMDIITSHIKLLIQYIGVEYNINKYHNSSDVPKMACKLEVSAI